MPDNKVVQHSLVQSVHGTVKCTRNLNAICKRFDFVIKQLKKRANNSIPKVRISTVFDRNMSKHNVIVILRRRSALSTENTVIDTEYGMHTATLRHYRDSTGQQGER